MLGPNWVWNHLRAILYHLPPPTCSWRSPIPSARVSDPLNPPALSALSLKLRSGLGAARRSHPPALCSAPAAGRTGQLAWPPSHGNPPLQLPEGNSPSLKKPRRGAWRESSRKLRTEKLAWRRSQVRMSRPFSTCKLSACTCNSLNAHLKVS